MYLLHFAVVVDHLLKLQIESEERTYIFDFLQKHVCTGA